MRAKNILAVVPIPTFIKLAFERLTVSRISLYYFGFSLVYCISQLVFQIWAFKINNDAGIRLTHIIDASNIVADAAVLNAGQLSLCRSGINDCPVVWDSRTNNVLNRTDTLAPIATALEGNATPITTETLTGTSSAPSTSATTSSTSSTPSSVRPTSVGSASSVRGTGVAFFPTRLDDDDDDDDRKKVKRFTKRGDGIIRVDKDNVTGVFIPDLTFNGESGVVLNDSCVELLIWPRQKIRDTKREDVTFMAFQIWVMGMSVVALLNESIPHIIAAFITHFLATLWSSVQIYNTYLLRRDFGEFTNTPDRCSGINVLPSYWSKRNAAEVAVLSINAVFLVISFFFSYRLVKTFGWQTFKRIGASLEINRVYKIVLTFSIGLQLALFFVLASMGLWLDVILNTAFGGRAEKADLYKAFAIVVCILMVPWLFLGWTSVRKESKKLMGVFILVSTAMLGGWSGLFVSNTFRWTFVHWSFFAGISGASCFFTLMCMILGMICYRNFNKGLGSFLNAQQPLPGEDFTPMSPEDLEKSPTVQFPSPASIPTYEVNINSPDRYSPTGGLPTVAEYDQDSMGSMSSIRRPPLARAPSDSSSYSVLKRSASNGSERSTGSVTGPAKSYAIAGSHHAFNVAPTRQDSSASNNAKRGWVIE